MSALFGCGLLVTYVERIEHPFGEFAHFPFYCLSFVVWYPFYHLGLFAAKFKVADESGFCRSKTWMFLLYFLFVAGSCIEGVFLSRRGYSLGQSQLKATSLLASLALFFLILAYRRMTPGFFFGNRFVQLLGRSSYLIYLMHMLVFREIEMVLKGHASIYAHHLRYSLVSFSLTLIISVLFAGLIETASPSIRKLLGASSAVRRPTPRPDPVYVDRIP
jgi:peptidoglycan/LPS O-acetylase OafA/YrhL